MTKGEEKPGIERLGDGDFGSQKGGGGEKGQGNQKEEEQRGT